MSLIKNITLVATMLMGYAEFFPTIGHRGHPTRIFFGR